MKRKMHFIIGKKRLQIAILVFCYLALTFPLMGNALWHDEIYNTSLYLNTFPDLRPSSGENALQVSGWAAEWRWQIALHPPALSIFYYVWIRLFGDSEFSMHVPVLLAGLLGVILLYLLGCIVFDSDIGFVAALAMIFSSSYLMYSVQAVHAIFEMLIFLASALAFAHFVIKKNKKIFKILIFLNILGFGIFYCYFFYFLAQNIVLWIFRKSLGIKKIYFVASILLSVIFISFISFNYTKKQYSCSHWPKNSIFMAIKNIITLPRNFTH